MLKKLFLIVLICAFFAPTNIFAGDKKLYVAGSLGLLFTQDSELSSPDATLNATARGVNAKIELDTGVALTFAAGTEIMPKVRGEVEYSFRNAGGDKLKSDVGSLGLAGFDAESMALMFNGYYDFNSETKWKPYLGGGIGFGWVNINGAGLGVTVDQTSDAEFSYQVMGGLGYQYDANVTATMGYRYFGMNDPTFVNIVTASYDTHAVEIGVRYSF